MSKELLSNIINYLPYNVSEIYLSDPEQSHIGTEKRFPVVSLFADVSGFTKMSEALSVLGKEGAEQLTQILNSYFSSMINIIERYGGIVGKFGGDAMTIVFPKTEDVSWTDLVNRAVQCSLDMQKQMKSFAELETGAGTFGLTMKIGVSSGMLYTTIIGHEESRLEYIMAGNVLDDTADAEHHASPGEIVIDRKTALKSDDIEIGEDRNGFYPIKNLWKAVSESPLSQLSVDVSDSEFLIEILSHYLPKPIYDRLRLKQPGFIGEHRFVTILFLSFSGLNYDKDEEIGDKLQEFFVRIAKITDTFDGYINKADMGDKGSKIIILFGTPIAHENAEERALLTALKIQEFIPQLPFKIEVKIGVNTGYVFAGNVGAPQRQEYTVMGDAVNLSARLMGACQPNQILLSDSTYHKVSHRFECEKLEPINVKGKAEPIQIYQLNAQHEEGGARRLLNRYQGNMIGRKKELKTIKGILQKTVTASNGQIISIVGEAGIGKSRLIGEFIAMAYDEDFIGYGGECLSYGVNTPYLPWADLFTSFFDLETNDDSQTKIEKIRNRLIEANPQLENRLPLLGDLLGIKIPDNELTQHFDAKFRKESLFALVLELLKDKRLFLLLEDMHWIDDISMELVEHIARNISDQKIMLMLVHRPLSRFSRKRSDAIRKMSHHHLIELKHLSPDESIELINNKFNIKEIPDDFKQLVIERSQGNPFFVEELVHSLLDRNIIAWNEEIQAHEIVGDLSNVEIPDDINSLIMSRIDRLDEQSKLAIKVASVIGRFFKLSILEGVYPLQIKEEILRDHLDKLSGLELTPLDRPEPDWEYLFKHIITQEVAYESLLFAHRRELHEKVGKYFETQFTDSLEEFYPLLAYHYGLTHNMPKKLYYYEKAGDQAKHNFSNRAAISYYDNFVEESEDEAKNDQIEMRKGQILQLIGENLRAEELFSELSEKFKTREENEHYLAALYELQEIQRIVGNIERAKESIETGLDLAKTTNNKSYEGNFLRALGMWHQERSEHDKALEYFEEALMIQRNLGNGKEESRLLGAIGVLNFRKGKYEESIEFYSQALKVSQQLENKVLENMWLSNIAASNLYQGNYDKAIQYYKELIKNCRKVGDRIKEGIAYQNLGLTYFYWGFYKTALYNLNKALDISREVNDQILESEVLGNLGLIYQDTQKLEEAFSYYSQALNICRIIKDKRAQIIWSGNIGIIYYYQNDFEKSLQFYSNAVTLAKEVGDIAAQGNYLGNIGEIYQTQGKYKEALENYNQALQIAQEIGDQRAEGVWLGNIGNTYKLMGDYDKATNYLNQALQLNEKIGSTQYAAENYISIGEVETLTGNPNGIETIKKGLAIAEEIGNAAMIILGKKTLGKVLLDSGQKENGEKYLNDALKLAEESGMIKEVNEIREMLG